MSEPTLTCPKCGTEIRLTESLAAPLLAATRRDFEQRLAQKDSEAARREASLRDREDKLVAAQAALDDQVAARLKDERPKIAADEARKAQQNLGADIARQTAEITELQGVLKQRDLKLQEAQQAQAELLRKQRDLDDAKRELDLTVEKRVQAGLMAIREQVRQEGDTEWRLKVAEREQTISSMSEQIESLKRRAEQGSQQLQGEVQEVELETLLRARFPRDTIEPVAKGEHGGDVLQRVFGQSGQACGAILWESKRTKNWADGWLAKLRDDQRAAKVEIAIIISQVLPKGVEVFDLIDDVWVAHPRVTVPLATALRQSLIELAITRQASDGQQTKTEMIYTYLTGPRFRQRVQAIVEAFSSMQDDLARERKAITKQWAKREEQIERVMQATVGMYGDLQGIAGKTLQEIEGLDVRALAPPESHEAEPNASST